MNGTQATSAGPAVSPATGSAGAGAPQAQNAATTAASAPAQTQNAGILDEQAQESGAKETASDKALAEDASGRKGAAEAVGDNGGKGAEGGSDQGAVDGDASGAAGDVTDAWNKFIETVDPKLGIHKETLAGFSELARKLNMTPEAASELIAWSAQAAEKTRELATAEGRKQLAQEWGGAMETNQARATQVVALVDRALGNNRFRAAIEKYGVCADADFTMGMKYIADMLNEDMLATVHDAGGAQAPESALEALKKFYH